MVNQIILAVDDNGKFLEYIPKEIGHKGRGWRHLAIAVLLQNSKGEVLLQKRKHKIFDNIWDVTGATHPLHLENGQDESLEEATYRCLREEWGIGAVGDIRAIGEFNYNAQDGDCSENEHCWLMVGMYDGEVKANPEMIYEYKWMDINEFLEDIKQNPKNYTPWAKEGARLLPEYLQ